MALNPISDRLQEMGFANAEIRAVLEAIKICRNNTIFQSNGKIYKQIKGCGLGPPDSCAYCDIAINDIWRKAVPCAETEINVNLDFLSFFRDDGAVFYFSENSIIPILADYFNQNMKI